MGAPSERPFIFPILFPAAKVGIRRSIAVFYRESSTAIADGKCI